MPALQRFLGELGITIGDPGVWEAIALALIVGAGCLVGGVVVTRGIGLLPTDAPAGEMLGVGLSAGLMLVAAWWAAIGSGGRSSFTPVALGFAVAIALGIAQRLRQRPGDVVLRPPIGEAAAMDRAGARPRRVLIVLVGAAAFVVVMALTYGATLAPSARDGFQPVEFNDVAFYAVLGRDLATSGIETTMSASGFIDIPGVPDQSWYHWGELWLAAAVIEIFGVSAMAARYFVVLPVVLLAVAALTGTVVRRWTRAPSTTAFLFGFGACLLLAPVALLPGPFFSTWASGMAFGITTFGLGAVAPLLGLYCVPALRDREIHWPLAAFASSAVAFILPAHLAVALLALVGVAAVVTVRVARWVRGARRTGFLVSTGDMRIIAGLVIVGTATVVWGMATGHAFGGGTGQPLVEPFNDSWRASVAITTLGAGALFAIVVALPLTWRSHRAEAELYLGTLVIVIVGAIGWGARLGDFTMFYLFFAGIAVIATPAAAIASRTIWHRLTASGRPRLAFAVVVLVLLQLEAGVPNALLRLQHFGAQEHRIPLALLEEIRRLPPDAKLAYVCQPLDESGFGVPQLVSIDAHTGRRVIPMCFEAELLSYLNGATKSRDVENLFFALAPQRALYPDSTAAPDAATVAAFLERYGIEYIYIDEAHRGPLVDRVVPVATSGDAQVLQIP